MTTASERTSGFHSITSSYDSSGARVVDIDMFRECPVEVTNDPRFLGDEPARRNNGGCSRCDQPWMSHWDPDRGEWVTPRKFHRRDNGTREPGYYSDEITEAGQR